MVGALVRRPPIVSAFMQTLLDDANATAALATLGVVTGTYSPILTNSANLDASTAYVTSYIRIGAHVIVYGLVGADATAAASTATQLGISLPIASAITSVTEVAGTAVADTPSGAYQAARLIGNIANDRVQMDWQSQSTGAVTFSFIFAYPVV